MEFNPRLVGDACARWLRERGWVVGAFRTATREGFVGLLYLTVSQVVTACFLTAWGSMIAKRLPDMLSFSTERPFAFRVLTPWLMNQMLRLAPKERIEAFLRKPLLPDSSERVVDEALSRYDFPPELDVELLMLEFLLISVLVGTAYVTRATLRHFQLPSFVCLLGPAIFLFGLPLHFAGGGYIYDMPELLFASLATLFFCRGQWLAYYPILTLAVLNKESALLLTGFCLAFLLQKQWRLAVKHVSLHLLFALPPLIGTRVAFASHPGSDVVNYAAHNLEYLLSVSPYLARARTYDPLLPVPISLNVLLLALGAAFVFYRFRSKPIEVYGMFFGTWLAVLPLFLMFGYANEVRVFALCFPAGFVLAGYTLADLSGDGALDDGLSAPSERTSRTSVVRLDAEEGSGTRDSDVPAVG